MRPTFLTAVAVMTLGFLAGCTATPEPPTVEPADEPSASATPSPTKTVVAAATPERFVRQYVDAANVGLTSGDLADFRALSSTSCAFCVQTAKSIETFYANGGSYQGDASWHVLELGKPAGTDPATISMYVQVKPHKIVATKGATPRPDKGKVLLFDMTLGKEEGQWKVTDLAVSGGG